MSLVVDFIITIIYIVESSGSKKLVGKTKLNRLDIVTLCRLPAAGQWQVMFICCIDGKIAVDLFIAMSYAILLCFCRCSTPSNSTKRQWSRLLKYIAHTEL